MLTGIIKSFFKSDDAHFEEISLGILEKYRQEYTAKDYLNWLRKKFGQLKAISIAKEEVKGSVPADWQEKISMIEQEIKKNRG